MKTYIFLKEKKYIFIILVTLIYTFSFYSNTFCVANNSLFSNFEKKSEKLVVHGIIHKLENGFFASGGAMGYYKNLNDGSNNHNTISEFEPRGSQIGTQSMIFYPIWKLFKPEGKIYNSALVYKIATFLMSLFNAFTFALIFLWIYKEFSPKYAILTSIGVLLTYSNITVLGSNLYWMVGTWFLPFIISAFTLMKYQKSEPVFKGYLFFFLSICAVVILKCSMGYEYISTVLIAMILPVIYYSIKNKWGKTLFFKWFLIASLAGILGFIITLVMHYWQLSYFVDNPFDRIIYNIHKRTYSFGNFETANELINNSLISNPILLLIIYILGRFYNLPEILYLVIFSYIGWCYKKIYNFINPQEKTKLNALIITTMVSLLGPISWFILAKGHSYIHKAINCVLWSVPCNMLIILCFIIIIPKFFNKKRLK